MNAHGRCIIYPATNCCMHAITICFGIVYDYMFVHGIIIYHSVGFLHCPSQQQGQCEGLRLGMDEAKSSLFSYIDRSSIM